MNKRKKKSKRNALCLHCCYSFVMFLFLSSSFDPRQGIGIFGGGFVLEKSGENKKFLSVLARWVQPTDGNKKNVELFDLAFV